METDAKDLAEPKLMLCDCGVSVQGSGRACVWNPKSEDVHLVLWDVPKEAGTHTIAVMGIGSVKCCPVCGFQLTLEQSIPVRYVPEPARKYLAAVNRNAPVKAPEGKPFDFKIQPPSET